MKISLPLELISKFFLKGGATSAVFNWLNFRYFVAQNKLKLQPINNLSSEELSATSYLFQWRNQHKLIYPKPWFLGFLYIAVTIIGFSTMAGVLNYNHNKPINLWLPIALFALIPFLMTLISLYFSTLSTTKNLNDGHPIISIFIDKLSLASFLPYKNLLFPWLYLKFQSLAVLFSISALLSFFIMATFQDYSFAWSSTLITDDQTMTKLIALLCWPWHWLVETPSAELISQSRLMVKNTSFDGISGESWWLTLVMAMIVYGILPRLLLALFLHQRLINKLRLSIENSGDVEQFFLAQSHQSSHKPIISKKDYASPDNVEIHRTNADLITWQQPRSTLNIIKNLGNSDWLEDEEWLSSSKSNRANPVFVLVDPAQTPTGELADSIAVLKQNNQVDLVLYNPRIDETRYSTQLKSWQFFAKNHNITLKKGI